MMNEAEWEQFVRGFRMLTLHFCHILSINSHALVECRECGKRRRFENMAVSIGGDRLAFYCMPGHGCNKRRAV